MSSTDQKEPFTLLVAEQESNVSEQESNETNSTTNVWNVANIKVESEIDECRSIVDELITDISKEECRGVVDDMLTSVASQEDQQQYTSIDYTQGSSQAYSLHDMAGVSQANDQFVELTIMDSQSSSEHSSQTTYVELTSLSASTSQGYHEMTSVQVDQEDEEKFQNLTRMETSDTQYYEMSNMETGESEFCMVSTEETEYELLSNIPPKQENSDSNMTLVGEHELNEESSSMSIVEDSISSVVLSAAESSSNDQEQEPSNGQDRRSKGTRMRRANITDRQKYLIEFLHTENGLSAEEIRQHHSLIRADGTKILLKTVKYWLERFKKTGEMKTKHRSGRPRFLDDGKEKELIEYIDQNTKKNYHDIKRNIHLTCTRRTVNNYALRNGIKAYRALKKPKLTDAQKAARLRFVEEWLTRFEDSQKIIFTDEKLFAGQPTNNHQLVRRRKGERYDEKNINHTNRPNLARSTNVWCYIGPFGKGELFLAENDEYFDEDGVRIKKDIDPHKVAFFNNASYKNMLEKRAIPAIKSQIDDFIFMQDNASIHSAMNKDKTDTIIGELLKKEGVKTMYWPPLSPDLNPIENVHHLLQNEMNDELTRMEKMPRNKQEVFALLKDCWTRVDNEVVKKIYFSFYGRLSKVKERLGSNNYD